MRVLLKRDRVRNERGAVASEYAIMASLIALMIIGGMTAFGRSIGALFQSVAQNWP